MTPPGAKSEKLSMLDYVFSVLSNAYSPLDFALVLHLPTPPDIEALLIGARSARNKYPITSSFVHRGRWEHVANQVAEIEQAATADEQSRIEDFVDVPFDLKVDTPCRQLLITQNSGGAALVTRFHHAAADGLSAVMWLSHQLRVALGLERPVKMPAFYARPLLRHLSDSVRRSEFAYSGPSQPLITYGNRRSGRRRWITFDFDATQLRRACRSVGGFTYNDLLATCALEVLTCWNRLHGGSDEQQTGLWLPMNIRRETSTGFGNGTSRIRLYPRYSPNTSVVDRARAVRRQVSWCTEHGEWVVPEIPLLRDLPQWATAPFLRTYLNRRSVDMATAIFSHSDSWGGGAGQGLQAADRIECIGLLHPRQSLALNGTTHRGRTSLTITYDSGLLSHTEAKQFSELYQEQVALAKKELFLAASP